MRRGQMEMIGLVFIVVILVLGVLLYARFSVPQEGSTDDSVQGATSFLVALAETGLCGTSFQRVAAACVEDRAFCASGDPCMEAQLLMEEIASAALDSRGVKYNLSIQGTGVMVHTPDCVSADPLTDIVAAPNVEIVLSGGQGTRRMTLAVCE